MDQVSGTPDAPDLTQPLPGRERDLSELSALLKRALQGDGSVALISGEAGIGKTTLSEHLSGHARHYRATVVTGNCYRTTTGQALAPWREIRKTLLSVLPAQVVASFAGNPNSVETPGSREELFERTVHDFRQAAGYQPVVVTIEDIHWADMASLELLRYLARQVATLPILLVATYREDEPEPASALPTMLPDIIRESRAHRFELRRLTLPDVQEFVRASQPSPLEADTVRTLSGYLHTRSEGNPFFMTELFRDLAREGDTSADLPGNPVDLESLPVPSLVRQVIENRVHRLAPDTQMLLRTAAVIGQEIPIDLWQCVSNVSDAVLVTAIEESITNHLLRESGDGGTVRFLHGLIQETLYHGQIALRRRTLHRQIAECMATQPNPSPVAVAHHFERAGDARAIEWLVQGAGEALEIYAARDAIRSIDRATHLAARTGVPLPQAGYRIRAQASELLGETDQARLNYQHLLQSAREACDQAAECQALIDLGLLWAGSDYHKSGEYLFEARRIATRLGDERLQARCLNRLGNWEANTGQLADAINLHRQALAMFEAVDDQDGVADTLDLLGSTNFLAGNYRASVNWYDRAIEQSRTLNDRRRLSSSLANLAIIGGDFDVSFDAGVAAARAPDIWVSYGEEAVRIAREIGWRSGESFALAMLGSIIAVRGDAGRGVRLVTKAHEIAHRLQHQQWLICTSLIMGSLWIELLDPSRAALYFERGRALAEGVGSQLWSVLLDTALATLEAERGDTAASFALLERWSGFDESARSHAQRARQYGTARIHLAAGNPSAALAIAEGLLSLEEVPSDVKGVPQVLALKADALAMLDRLDEADDAYRDAAHAADTLGYRSVQWRILRDWGRVAAMRQRQSAQATGLFEQASDLAGSIARTISDPETRNRFLYRASGSIREAQEKKLGSRKRERSGLSSRQVEVLSLVALGMTDAQVAERLFISPRTVARHLQAIYNQLGVNSRTAAVTSAYGLDLIEPPGSRQR